MGRPPVALLLAAAALLACDSDEPPATVERTQVGDTLVVDWPER